MNSRVDLLVTGFGPFPGIPNNPSATLARKVAAHLRLKRAGLSVAMQLIPTEYAAAERLVPQMVAEMRPRAVLMFGVASKRKALSVELRARNRLSLLHPDAAGQRPTRLVLEPGAAWARHGRAPFTQAVQMGLRAGLPTRLSISAGTYLCNFAYWRMLAATDGPCLFLHIPKIRSRQMMARLVEASVAIAAAMTRR